MVRRVDWAEPSLAARLEARRLGIAMAAIIPIIATTMRSSISENPSWRLFVYISFLLSLEKEFRCFSRQRFVVTMCASAKCQAGLLQALCHLGGRVNTQ